MTTVFVSSGLQEISEYTNGVLSQSYVFGSYIDEPLVMVKANGDKFYYHTNDLYSVAALTDTNGNIVERYKYDPYGKVTILAPDGTTTRTSSSVSNPASTERGEDQLDLPHLRCTLDDQEIRGDRRACTVNDFD